MAVGIPGARPFGGHTGPVSCVVFSPDGTAFATGGGDGVVRLWDTATGDQTRQLVGHVSAVRAVAWNPDGASLASGGDDQVVRLWDVSSGQPAGQLTGHSHQVRTVAWSPDGTAIASGAHSVRLWDAGTGQQTRKFTAHTHPVNAVAWSPDGRTIASGADSVRLWEPDTGRVLAQVTGLGQSVECVAWHPDGTALATCAGSVRIWNPGSGALIREITGVIGDVRSIAWNPGGTIIATAGDDTVRLWDPATGTQTNQLTRYTGPTGLLLAIAWSPEGTTIATVGDDDTVRLWDPATGTQTNQLTGHTGPVLAVAWSPDGTTIATGGDSTVRLWDPATGTQTNQLTGHAGPVRAVAWNRDGTIIASASFYGLTYLWDPATGTETRQLTGHTGPVDAVAWNPDGTTIATANIDGTARLWNGATGTETNQLTGHGNIVVDIAWNRDGTVIATASGDGTARLWDPATAAQTNQLTGHTGIVHAVAWSPDDTTIATAGQDGTARLWDPATGTETNQLTGHAGPVRAVAWSPDGTTIATAGDDGTRLWDPATAAQTNQLTGHTGPVAAVAWNPNGTLLATVGYDGTIRIWNPRNGTQLNGTGFGVPRAAPRPLAGVRSDSPSAEDLLGIGDDVGTLAELIAATETRPPLAVALIGDWGAGKSSVMLQVESRVTELATKARNNPGLSAFAENVRQVRFNAWHYSDDHLWAGLVSHLFEGLARPENPEAGQDLPAERSARAEIARVRGELAGQENRLTDKQADADRIAAELKETARPEGVLQWLGAPVNVRKVVLVAGRQARQDVRGVSLTLLILSWVVLGAAAYAAWRFLGAGAGSVAAAVAVLAAPAVAVLRKLRPAYDWLLAFADKQRTGLVASQQQAQQEVRDAERKIHELKDQLVLVDAAEGLARFLDDQAEGTAYRQYGGLLGQVRADLDQLSVRLKKAREQWARGGRFGSPPLERIVLYIDDLDRCPPRRVVEVLEAVHLMLALDLFVVVVAVDARWLIRSLDYHYEELFRSGNGHRKKRDSQPADVRPPADGRLAADGSVPRLSHDDEEEKDGPGLATPVDYLDKIFQVPFVLPPPEPAATALYLRSLLPKPVRAVVSGAAGTPGATVRGAGGGADRPEPAAGAATAEPRPGAPVDGAGENGAGKNGAGKNDSREVAASADRGDRADRGGLDEPGRFPQDESDLLGGLRRGAGARSAAGLSEPTPGPTVVELRPQGLELTQPEVEFMARLGGLLPTPRAAKRLVNIYRLVRIGIPTAELAGFIGDEAGGPYQAVQVLLAMLVGQPLFAREVFREVIAGHHGQDLAAVVKEVGGRDEATPSFRIIHSFLIAIRGKAPLAVSIELGRRWCPRLARFSFYTRELAGGYLNGADDAAVGAETV